MILNKTYLLHWKLIMKCKIIYSLITIKKLKREFHNKIPQYICIFTGQKSFCTKIFPYIFYMKPLIFTNILRSFLIRLSWIFHLSKGELNLILEFILIISYIYFLKVNTFLKSLSMLICLKEQTENSLSLKPTK